MNSRNSSQSAAALRKSNYKSDYIINNGGSSSPSTTSVKSISNHLQMHGSFSESGEEVKDVENEIDGGGRERLKRHREEVAGNVLIPDKWGQEDLLKDWIECSAFEALLVPTKIASARDALVADGTRASRPISHNHHHQQQQLRIEIKTLVSYLEDSTPKSPRSSSTIYINKALNLAEATTYRSLP